MEPREHDLRTKLEALQELLDAGSDAKTLMRAAESTLLALEFRATDAMIGLPEIPSDLLARAERTVAEAQLAAARAGLPEACVQLADSIWVAQDEARAALALELVCAAPEDPRALHLHGLFRFNGFGCEPDLARAFELYLQAAGSGHADSMFELYAMSAQGLGCVADADAALEWCKRAAQAGNARAMANLGGFHATGRGLSRDPQSAVYWYDRAARAGHGKAAATLGVMYALGSDVTPSAHAAQRYFALAEELGFDWRSLARATGVDLPDLMSVTLRPPPPPAPAAPKTRKKPTKPRKTKAKTKTKTKAKVRAKTKARKKR